MIPLNVGKQPIPQQGDLLLSEPFLPDTNFSRAVILICEHTAEGTFGLILNQSIDIEMTSLSDDFPGHQIPTGFGGPVERNHLYFLHNNPEIEGGLQIQENLFLGGDYEQLKTKINAHEMPKNSLRFFIGYTGWVAGQLQQELEDYSWIVVKKNDQFNPLERHSDGLWKELLRGLGGKYKFMLDYPINPADN